MTSSNEPQRPVSAASNGARGGTNGNPRSPNGNEPHGPIRSRLVIVSVATPDDVADDALPAFRHLLSQLSSHAPPLTAATLREIVASPATILFIARAEGTLAGMLTLAVFRIPSGTRAWIEDVVVDPAQRQSGIGAALVEAAVAKAANLGARTVDLTSRPDREAANRLYQRMSFVRRDTNVYRLSFPD